jgi:capsular exopolysaccharide synthesis family protein
MNDLTPFRGAEGPQPRSPHAGGVRPRFEMEDGDADVIELRDVLNVLRRNIGLVLGITVLTLALAAVVVLRQVPEYRATSVIRLQDERGAMTRGLQGAAVQQAMGKMDDPLLSQLQVLRSRRVAGEVVDRLGMRVQAGSGAFDRALLAGVVTPDPTSSDTLRLAFGAAEYELQRRGRRLAAAPYGTQLATPVITLTIRERPPVGEAELFVSPRERAIDQLLDQFRATARERTDVVDVQFTATDAALAQHVVNEMVAEFQTLSASAARDQSRRRRVFVEEQLAHTEQMLVEAQLQLTQFRELKQVYGSPQRLAAQQEGLMGLEVRREEMDADRRMFGSLLASLRAAGDDGGRSLGTLVSTPGISANPMIASLFEQLMRYETSLDSLTTGEWGAAGTNPDVRRLQELAATSRTRLVEAVGSHVAALDARLAALDGLRDRSASGLAALPATEAEEARLVQEVETVRRVADQLREEYQRARIAEAVEAGQVEIVDVAPLPAEPVGSRRGLKLALGLMLGLMLGSGSAFVRESLNTRLTRRDELEPVLGLPGLAVIPRISANGKRRFRVPLRRALGRSRGTAVARPLQELVTLDDVATPGAEAYRSLRTNLIFPHGSAAMRSIMVTSAMPAEGKTTTAANLAVTFAQQGLNVVIVDGDFRKARLHRIFDVERAPGTTDVIVGRAELEDVLRATPVPGLSVLSAGTAPPNPSELLGSEPMQRLLRLLEEQYDLVIIDAPPVLVAGDASIVATMVSGTIVVVRAGATERAAAAAAVKQLRVVGARLLGAVLNDPDARVPSSEPYYYAYGYYGDDQAS